MLSSAQCEASGIHIPLQLELGVGQTQQIINLRQGESIDVAALGSDHFDGFQMVCQAVMAELQILQMLAQLGQEGLLFLDFLVKRPPFLLR